MISDIDLAYISKHAISPLHERDGEIDSSNVRGVTAFIGILGHLTRNSTKQWPANCACIFGDTLVVGSLKHTMKPLGEGTFYDVRTALPTDEVNNQDMLEQGRSAGDGIARWFIEPPDDDSTLADRIPFLPRRSDDYTLRSAVVRH